MDIRVSGHQVDTGEALRQHVQERLAAIADKYFSRAISAQVTFGKGPHDYASSSRVRARRPTPIPPSIRPRTGSRSSSAAT
jgi:ribosome-associated translation inhibitor RaiA